MPRFLFFRKYQNENSHLWWHKISIYKELLIISSALSDNHGINSYKKCALIKSIDSIEWELCFISIGNKLGKPYLLTKTLWMPTFCIQIDKPFLLVKCQSPTNWKGDSSLKKGVQKSKCHTEALGQSSLDKGQRLIN